MITDECAICMERFEFDDPSQMHSIWNESLGMPLLICDPCADRMDQE